ncbi:hypothetical protein [Pseudoxanthomonas composti]|uniref:Uncharacterized protein n=1 Tax=Pseudoxanthomonas composti TaxID=2137479 RepID=A0A4Q1JX71_9GAMM|nr:hypothetical protein [Pseudoxanthomonas composti]RXR06147.1 hypothetical protein EPA99_09960 [Pseudoxanthomonas composti]
MDITRVLRGLAWFVLGAASLAVLLYLALLAINWSDEPPSGDVATLRTLLESPPVVDADNGYVYALGLVVAADQDPLAQGAKRRAYLESLTATDRDHDGLSIPGERNHYVAERPAVVSLLESACKRGGADCAVLLERSTDTLDVWMRSEGWLLERYRQLIQRARWREVVPSNISGPLPAYQHLMHGQELYLLEAWRAGRAGDARVVRDHLQRDLRFWREVLRSSSLLITKVIAAAAVDRNFAYGSLALRALPAELQHEAIPASWREPIAREERAMFRALAGEHRWSDAAILRGEGLVVTESLTDGALADHLMRPLFQPQATSNLYAASLLEMARAFDVAELTQMPDVLERRRDTGGSGLRVLLHPYNPVGHVSIEIAKPSYIDYLPRAADLEGARRAALLAATLRTQGVTPADAAAAIRASPLTDPYTGAPLRWDAEHTSVVFTGLARGERQRRSVPL